MNTELNVLLVKGSPQDIRLIEFVAASGVNGSVKIQSTATLEDALFYLSQQSFDLVLLGQHLPDTAETQFAVRMLEFATAATVMSLSDGSLSDESLSDQCAQSACSPYPHDSQVLVDALNSAMESKSSVTQLAHAIQRLQVSEERYALAAEGCRDGIWDWNIAGNSVYYSPHWLAMLGCESTSPGEPSEDSEAAAINAINGHGESKSATLDYWFDRVHPEDIDGLKRSLEAHLSKRHADFRCEYRIRREDGTYMWVLSRGRARWDSNGNPYRMAGSQIDIHEHKQLAWQANHDDLTNLANRHQFLTLLEQFSAAQLSATHIVCYLDLDHFKVVNDTCGHAAGDELLRQVSAMLTSNIRRSDLLARLGGDEFGLIICDCSLDQAIGIAHNLVELIKQYRFYWEGKVFSIGVSIGLVPVPTTQIDASELLSLADSACYAAKNQGRNQVQVYSQANAGIIRLCADHQWVNNLTQALEQDLFCLYYQEVRPLKPERDVMWEVLLRLPNEVTEALTLPMAFIPPAKRYDLMSRLDRWMIRQCFAQMKSAGRSDIIYSLNLSGDALSDDSFTGFLKDAIAHFQLKPDRICFEISESTLMANFGQVSIAMKRLKAAGFRLALDNFGSNVSSLVDLNQLPIDYLKLDGGLVAKINHDKVAFATLQSINNIGHIMGVETIAGCVSDAALLKTVEGLSMDYAQGFGIAKPVLFAPESSRCVALAVRAKEAVGVRSPHILAAS